jgi:hypothetical protein
VHCFRHCKSRKRKFEIKGKVTEPSFHTIQLESVAGKEPYTKTFILENGEITIAIDKDSIQKIKFQVHTVTMSMLNLMKLK